MLSRHLTQRGEAPRFQRLFFLAQRLEGRGQILVALRIVGSCLDRRRKRFGRLEMFARAEQRDPRGFEPGRGAGTLCLTDGLRLTSIQSGEKGLVGLVRQTEAFRVFQSG